MRYYLDSNIFIYPAIYKGKKAEKCKEILRKVINGEDTAVTASLTIDEVVWKIAKEFSREKAIKEGYRIFQFPNLNVLDVRSSDVLEALRLMEKYRKGIWAEATAEATHPPVV